MRPHKFLARSAWLAPLVVTLAALPCRAGLLDPDQFASLGTFPTLAGTYTVNTSGTPTITGPGGASITGVIFNGIAVFDFTSINLAANQQIVATGALPLALLSRSDAVIGGTVDVSSNYANVPGTTQFFAVPGSGSLSNGPGQGGVGGSYNAGGPGTAIGGSGGGGFGGKGTTGDGLNFGPAQAPGGPGGATYGQIFNTFQGGSAGGSSGFSNGGAGGGAVEIGAVGTLSVTGSVLANGGSAFPGPTFALNYGGGGGSGGGILLDGADVNLTGILSALGGAGSGSGIFENEINQFAGGAGGGGEIGIAHTSSLVNSATIAVGNGVVTYSPAVVPEPQSILMAAQATLICLAIRHARGRRRA